MKTVTRFMFSTTYFCILICLGSSEKLNKTPFIHITSVSSHVTQRISTKPRWQTYIKFCQAIEICFNLVNFNLP